MHFSRCLLVFFSLFLVLADMAQSADDESDEPLVSPEVAADQRVTFRVEAPLADTVKLRGIQRVPVNMTKGPHGVWSVTVGPLAAGIYGYSFVIDGEASLDPENPLVKPERSTDESLLEVFTTPRQIYQWQDVPHGTVHLHDYFSAPLKRLRRLRVYTPPDYDVLRGGKYPVLYLFHGTGDTEATWTEFGRAHYIMDNLLSKKKAVPMIIVMTDGHADLHDEEGISPRNLEEFEADLLQSVVQLIDTTYRTLPDSRHRAICGLSMGGIQSLFTGLRHTEKFAWIGGMSGWVPDAEKNCAAALEDRSLSEKVRLLWLQMGRDDPYLPKYKEFDSVLEGRGISRSFSITEGNHSWPVWREYLAEFASLLFRPAQDRSSHASGR